MAVFIPRFLRHLRDVDETGVADGDSLTYDSGTETWVPAAGGGGGGPPTGAAGGVLDGTYPNPGFDVDMATQAELDAHVSDITDAHDATAISVAPFGTIAATQVQAALEEIVAEAVADLGPAVILAPASSARNVIQPTAGTVIAAIVKAHAAQSVDLTRWVTSADAVLASIGSAGAFTISPSVFASTPTAQALRVAASGAPDAATQLTLAGIYSTATGLGAAAMGYVYALWMEAYTDAASSGDALALSGVYGYSEHRGAGQISVATGVAGFSKLASGAAGSITEQHAGSFGVENLSSQEIVYGTAVLAGLPYIGGGAGQRYTNLYGFYAADQGHAKATNAYGLYLEPQTGLYAIYAGGGKSLFVDGLVIALIAAPADAAYANGEGGFWWDQANSLYKWKGKTSAGVVVNLTPYVVGGTDVALTDGGTGASTAAGARTNLDVPSNAEAILDALVDAKGDLIAATAADTPARLAVGANGHVLTADSAEATGIKWAAAAGGGAVATDVIFDAKGDLPVGTAADTAVRLAAGANGATLSAASGEASGLAWVPNAAHPGFVSGRYYGVRNAGANSAGASTTNRLMLMPFYVPVLTTFDRIGMWVNTNGTATSVLRLGVYNNNAGAPGTVNFDAGTVAIDAGAAVLKTITISQALAAGWYWLAMAVQVANSGNLGRVYAVGDYETGIITPGNAQVIAAFNSDGVTGAFAAAPALTQWANAGVPQVLLRAA